MTRASSLRREPVPAWVTREEPDANPAPYVDGVPGGMVNALVDDQVRVSATVEHYVHRARRVLSVSGLETVGEVSIDVDPSYETLVLHQIHIVRGSERIDVLPATHVRTVQNEGGDERTYDDAVTEVFLLPDVRVGDVLDYEYTIRGQNAVFGGRFVRSMPIVESLRTERLRVRLLAPAARSIHTELVGPKLEPRERIDGANRELVWEWRGVDAARPGADAAVDAGAEAGAAGGHDSLAWIRMSEFSGWSDVVDWGVPLFSRNEEPSPQLDETVRQIERAHGDPLDRARAALDFVQKQIRYLGIETGEHSHLPHAPREVLSQRFGDCKDKSLLLVTMLRRLGIDAAVALVNPGLGAEVKAALPGPLAFNHAIVRVRLGGRTFFVDPTLSHQGGSLEARSSLGYGAALVLTPGTTALDEIPVTTPRDPTTEALSEYTIGPGPNEALLEVVTTYRGADADARREELEETPRARLQSHYLEYYKATEPSARVAGDLGVSDDVDANVLVVREHYAIPQFWAEGAAAICAPSLEHRLWSPGTEKPTRPLHVGPTFVREIVDVQFRRDPLPDLLPVKLGSPAITYTRHVEHRGTTLHVTFELRVDAHTIAPEAAAAHGHLVEEIEHDLSWTLPEQPKPKAEKPWTREDSYTLGAVVGVFGFGGLVVALRRIRLAVRRRRYRRGARIQAGESATTALDVLDRSEAERAMTRARCGCGGTLADGAGRTWSAIRIGDRTVDVVRASCTACGRAAAWYFRMRA